MDLRPAVLGRYDSRSRDESTAFGGQAMVQAIEVGPGDGGVGATPVSVVGVISRSRQAT